LPTCVEIWMTLRTEGPVAAGTDPLSLFGAPNASLDRTYRLVVALPAAVAATSGSTTSSTMEAATEAAP